MYQYTAKLVRVIDGDTVVLDVDLGFRINLRETFRLANINAFELRENLGLSAKQFVIDWFTQRPIAEIISEKPLKQEKYGRWLVRISYNDICLNDALIHAGLAVPD
jgi:micrococcal nuclease